MSVKQFGSRSEPPFCRSWSGSKLFAKNYQVAAGRQRVKWFVWKAGYPRNRVRYRRNLLRLLGISISSKLMFDSSFSFDAIHIECSILYICRGHWLWLPNKIILYPLKIAFCLSKQCRPWCNAAFHLGLHCLTKYSLGFTSIKWFELSF